MQHARAPSHQRGGVLAGLDSPPGRLDADQRHVPVVEEGGEDPDRVRAAADARDDHVRELAVERQVLLARFVADHPL